MTNPQQQYDKQTALQTVLKKHTSNLAQILPNSMRAEKMIAMTLAEAYKNPALLNCEPESVYFAVNQAAQLGLYVGGSKPQASLVPFKNKAHLIIGYPGYIALAHRAGVTIHAEAVYENDYFSVIFGTEPRIEHSPVNTSRGDLIAVYAVARGQNMPPVSKVLYLEELVKVKEQATQGKGKTGPWFEHFDAMCVKTAIRRLAQQLPMCMDVQEAERINNSAGSDHIPSDLTIDADTGEIINPVAA